MERTERRRIKGFIASPQGTPSTRICLRARSNWHESVGWGTRLGETPATWLTWQPFLGQVSWALGRGLHSCWNDVSPSSRHPRCLWSLPGVFLNVLITTRYMMNTEQAYVLRLQYVKELENLVEWVVILSASFTILTKEVICIVCFVFSWATTTVDLIN